MFQQGKLDKAVSLLHCHRSPSGRFYSFLHSPGISSPGIFLLPDLGKAPAMQTHTLTWKLARMTCNIWHDKNHFFLKVLLISKPKGRQRRKESKWYICLDSFLYSCLMITDPQLWDVKLLTLHEFPVEGIQFGWAKAFLFIIYSPNTQKPLDWLYIYNPVISSAIATKFVRPSFILILQVSVFKS